MQTLAIGIRLLWAACCVEFFGFLRSGKLTAPEQEEFDQSQHLTFADLAIDNGSNSWIMSVRIKQSNPSEKGSPST